MSYNIEVTHPSERIFSTKSDLLVGKTIGLGITGSVAAFLSPKIARELIRNGAKVIPIMTKAALDMIGKDLMWWATGVEPITKITGGLEHISMAGVMNKPVDLMLIAPCTTNTLAKIASGVADTPVTIIASSLNGKKIPLLLLVVAHEDLVNSPPIQDGMRKLKDYGVKFIDPVMAEGKAKVPDIDDIIFDVFDILRYKSLKGTKIIITGGPTRSYIDNVRFISNASSGKTGIEFAKEAYFYGADVSLIMGPHNQKIPRKIHTINVISSEEMAEEVLKLLENNNDAIVILSAAMSDFKPKTKTQGKIKSGNDLVLELEPTIKLSDIIKKKYPNAKLVLFKAEWDIPKDELINRAKNKMKNCNADVIVANDLSKDDSGFQTDTNTVYIIDKSDNIFPYSLTKQKIAHKFFELIETGELSL